MLRSARFVTTTVRNYSTTVQAPKQPVHLGALADNVGAVSQVTFATNHTTTTSTTIATRLYPIAAWY